MENTQFQQGQFAAMKQLTENDVEFIIECLPEDAPIKGNCIATGDDKEDEKYEKQLIENLKHNEWVWCCVRVTAKWNDFTGSDFLGGCSYESEEDFKQSGYYENMKSRALKELNEVVEAQWTLLKNWANEIKVLQEKK